MGVVFIRTIIIFAALLFSIRIMGKRQLGELEPNELVVAVLISNLAAQPLQDLSTPLVYGLVPVLTLLSCQVIISGATMKSPRLRCAISGRPSILIENGKIDQKEMKKNRITLDELAVELRQNSITDISTVKYAILETSGKLSLLLYSAEAPVTPKQLSLNPTDKGLPITVICDGHVISDNLRILGVDDKWLKKQLSTRNAKSSKDVYFMNVDEKKNIYFLIKEAQK